MVLMELGLCGPRPSQTSSSASKVSEVLGWSIRWRPTMSRALATPFLNVSLLDSSSRRGDSMPLAATMKVLAVTLCTFLSGS
ncbi:hypothetical protein D3C78_1376180 [compost metagenome]